MYIIMQYLTNIIKHLEVNLLCFSCGRLQLFFSVFDLFIQLLYLLVPLVWRVLAKQLCLHATQREAGRLTLHLL